MIPYNLYLTIFGNLVILITTGKFEGIGFESIVFEKDRKKVVWMYFCGNKIRHNEFPTNTGRFVPFVFDLGLAYIFSFLKNTTKLKQQNIRTWYWKLLKSMYSRTIQSKSFKIIKRRLSVSKKHKKMTRRIRDIKKNSYNVQVEKNILQFNNKASLK